MASDSLEHFSASSVIVQVTWAPLRAGESLCIGLKTHWRAFHCQQCHSAGGAGLSPCKEQGTNRSALIYEQALREEGLHTCMYRGATCR